MLTPACFDGTRVVYESPCADEQKDGDETDVDCGGAVCARCGPGRRCNDPTDCGSLVCSDGTCGPLSCSNGVRDGAESDIDCGGGCFRRCGAAKNCDRDADCWNNDCASGTCSAVCLADTVRVADSVCVDRTEVAVSAYAAWLASSPDTSRQSAACVLNTSFAPKRNGAGGCTIREFDPDAAGSLPVRCVDPCDALAYCDAIGKVLCGAIAGGANDVTSLDDASQSVFFAACTSGAYRLPYGDNYVAGACNVASTGPLPVDDNATCAAGPILNLVGNVAEWQAARTASRAFIGVARGGSFASASETICRSDSSAVVTSLREANASTGFRCCSPGGAQNQGRR
ncbi:MAG: SUMF1/EgtB/PvdO family nonheme iron enzyme [Deltaproteobacteria bacterium]|nr:SUMF1/EgtB/PvdO family nonheme iron enzyme [Deltaproteobacteria bacterium]